MKKVILWLVGGVLALVLILLVIGFFLPADVKVTRSAEIAATPAEIHAKVGDLTKWREWATWWRQFPDIKETITGEPTAVGSFSQWPGGEGYEAGKMTIKETGLDGFHTELAFGSEGEHVGQSRVKYESAGTVTKVTWSIELNMGGSPIGRWMGTMMDSMMGPDLDKGLTNLKGLLEAPAAPSGQ